MSHSSQREAQASVTAHPAQSPDPKRRRFLLALSAGGVGAAAAAAQPLAAPTTGQATSDGDNAARGYRETEHVRDYYATTRI
ncbi:MAG: formate dehydrogenase [Burkholderiales bacterium]|nr:formate dehydrogenase [Burkholderiales bacterium]